MIFVDVDWGSPTFDAECWCGGEKGTRQMRTPRFWFPPSSSETLTETFSNSSISLKNRDNKAKIVFLFLRSLRV